MSSTARVTSIEEVRTFRGALAQFGAESTEALTMIHLAIRKALQWLQQDRARYWPEQLRRAQERVVQARNDLERCQLRYGSEQAPSCMEQKKALERARRRLRFCEEKVKLVKQWGHKLREELDEFHGEVAKLSNWLDADLPQALASLERMLVALDRYAELNRGGPQEGLTTALPAAPPSGESSEPGRTQSLPVPPTSPEGNAP